MTSYWFTVPGRTATGFHWLIGTLFHPVEFGACWNIIIILQTVPAIGALWLEQAVPTAEREMRRGINTAKPRKFTNGVGHRHLITNNTSIYYDRMQRVEVEIE